MRVFSKNIFICSLKIIFFKKKNYLKTFFLYFKILRKQKFYYWSTFFLSILLKYFIFWSKLLIIVEAFLQDVLSFYLIQIQPKIQEVHKLLVDES